MDAESWAQGSGIVKSMEQMSSVSNVSNSGCSPKPNLMEKRATTKPPTQKKEQALNCPRCNSVNTKFCYYNNYSLTQPRYFCKACRRYWTEGGSLRNVPVGGGSRKNKRSSLTISSASASGTEHSSFFRGPDLNPPSLSLLPCSQNPTNTVHGVNHDLNLGTYLGLSQFAHHGPKLEPNSTTTTTQPQQLHSSFALSSSSNSNNNNNDSAALPAALELLRTGIASSGLTSFIPASMGSNNVTLYNPASGLSFTADFKPAHNLNPVQGFPFGEMKQMNTNTSTHHHEVDQSNKVHGSSSGWWSSSSNGMIGGGSW